MSICVILCWGCTNELQGELNLELLNYIQSVEFQIQKMFVMPRVLN